MCLSRGRTKILEEIVEERAKELKKAKNIAEEKTREIKKHEANLGYFYKLTICTES